MEALDNANGIVGNPHGVGRELEAVGEPKDQVLGIDGMNCETIPIYAEFVNQGFVDMAEFEDIELCIISGSSIPNHSKERLTIRTSEKSISMIRLVSF